MAIQISFDVGGTFTDFILIDRANGDITVHKYPTTQDPAVGVLEGLSDLMEMAGADWEAVDRVIHATTLATNTVLERTGAETALLTTEGFRDVSIFGRQKRYDLYDLHMERQDPVVDREDIYEVDERIHPSRGVLSELDADSVAALADDIADEYESVAVSFLHSYLDDGHERAVETALEEAEGDVSVSRASAISKQYREYERTSTASVDAYVKPRVRAYLRDILSELEAQGYEGNFFIMKSSGGVATPKMIEAAPVQIIESGPVAGALNSAWLGRELGYDDVLSFDMGGTTAKICFVRDGEPTRTDVFEVDEKELKAGSGIPLTIPVIDMIEISAGGGSIAATTETGTVSVGPESAGADPGPICYGRGGTRATVTDADLVLGLLNPDNFLGGRMALDREGAIDGIEVDIAEPLDLDLYEAAWGVKEIVDDSMMEACRIQASERGLDPRDFAMISFGGAGPMHAVSVARALSIPRVLVPYGAGVASAKGLHVADIEFHLDQTRPVSLGDDVGETLNEVYSDLEAEGKALAREVDPTGSATVERSADMKYTGQAHEINATVPTGDLRGSGIEMIRDNFEDAYRSRYGYSSADEEIEGITWKVTVRAPTETPQVQKPGEPEAGDAYKGTREVYWKPGGFSEWDIYERRRLEPGQEADGPAVIEAENSTTVVPPGDRFSVDDYGNILIEVEG
jgi:N-methylhydantoinase A/oxoprolinase/acetone carboxylase beta subunit